MIYKWKLEEDYIIDIDASDAEFEFVSIKDNRMTIKAGYAWNGCSPKFSLFGLKMIGTPDGIIDYQTGKQMCYYATLVHDALYQFKIGNRKNADLMFYNILKNANFKMAKLYYIVVRVFGGLSW